MFGIVEDEIVAENKHRHNVIEQGNLEKYHDQLNSFNTQATLVLGFAVASLNSDNLIALGDDQSKYCLYKDDRMVWGYVFGISTVACLSISFTCIASSFYLIIRSQHFALYVGMRPALILVRKYRSRIILTFVFGLICFFLSAIATVWLFIGQNYRLLTAPPDNGSCAAGGGATGCADGGWGSNVVLLDDGSTRATCLNPHAAADHTLQRRVTRTFAIAVTVTFLGCMLFGAGFLAFIKYDFDKVERSKRNHASGSDVVRASRAPGRGRRSTGRGGVSNRGSSSTSSTEAPVVAAGAPANESRAGRP